MGVGSPSPDGSGNPFCFFFKNKKIGTDSRFRLLKKLLRKAERKTEDSQSKMDGKLLFMSVTRIGFHHGATVFARAQVQ